MSEHTSIEWTDYSWSPWWGCAPVSAGCAHCYAAGIAQRFRKIKYAKGGTRQRVKDWESPLKWNRNYFFFAQCNECGFRTRNYQRDAIGPYYHCPKCETGQFAIARPRVFPSMMDWLDEEVPIEWLHDFLNLVYETPNLDWLLLTKRPENWRGRILEAIAHVEGLGLDQDWPNREPHTKLGVWLNDWLGGDPPKNVWVGATAENQQTADFRIPELLEIPAKVRFLSFEPLIGPVDLAKIAVLPAVRDALTLKEPGLSYALHWVIVGGESGSKARPMHPEWAIRLRDLCQAASIPFFFKQWGEWEPMRCLGHLKESFKVPWARVSSGNRVPPALMYRIGKEYAGRLLDGREWSGFPDKNIFPPDGGKPGHPPEA